MRVALLLLTGSLVLGMGAGCATLPIETAPAADLDWDAKSDVEVIQILTFDADGDLRQTKVWFVRVDGQTYLRTSNSRWLANIRRDPDVTVRVEGVDYPQRAEIVEDPATIRAVHEVAAVKYGFSDRVISLIRARNPDVLRLDAR